MKSPLIMEGGDEADDRETSKFPLTRQQINQAMMDIEDMHPLRHFAKLDDIISFLRVFRRCQKKRKPDFSFALRETVLKEMDIKMPESDRDVIDDPFIILGYGVNSYFDIMWFMMRMFIFLSIFMLPVMGTICRWVPRILIQLSTASTSFPWATWGRLILIAGL